MLTALGKALRILRIENNEILKTMAEKLGVTSAYLSAIENGKREPTQSIMDKLFSAYDLTTPQKEQLLDAYYETIESVKIRISDRSAQQKNLGLVFARKFDSLSDEQISNLIRVLNQEEN